MNSGADIEIGDTYIDVTSNSGIVLDSNSGYIQLNSNSVVFKTETNCITFNSNKVMNSSKLSVSGQVNMEKSLSVSTGTVLNSLYFTINENGGGRTNLPFDQKSNGDVVVVSAQDDVMNVSAGESNCVIEMTNNSVVIHCAMYHSNTWTNSGVATFNNTIKLGDNLNVNSSNKYIHFKNSLTINSVVTFNSEYTNSGLT